MSDSERDLLDRLVRSWRAATSRCPRSTSRSAHSSRQAALIRRFRPRSSHSREWLGGPLTTSRSWTNRESGTAPARRARDTLVGRTHHSTSKEWGFPASSARDAEPLVSMWEQEVLGHVAEHPTCFVESFGQFADDCDVLSDGMGQ